MSRLLKNNCFVLASCSLLTLACLWVINADISRETSEQIKIWLCGAALALILIWPLIQKKSAVILLSLLTIISTLNYLRWSPDILTKRIDSYDVIHYYIGTRYFDELSYYDLYPAIILADHENGPLTRNLAEYRAQDIEHGYEVKPIEDALQHGRQVRETKFTPARWKQFEHDFLYLQRNFQLTKTLWRTLINDRGFNATPAWIFLMQPITHWVSVEQIKWLCAFDILLLAAGLLAIRWAYGNITALWGLLFFMLSYSGRWPVISMTFFRYDWICTLMVAMACIKKNRYFLGGWLTGLAALYRLFPAAWLCGPAVKAAIHLLREKAWPQRLNKPLLLLGAGFILCTGIIASTTIMTLGIEPIKAHINDISEHLQPEELSSRRMGFALSLAYDGNLLPTHISDEHKAKIKNQTLLRTTLALLLLGALAWLCRNKRDDETFAYGFIPFFLLTTASYYYAIARATLIIIHSYNLDQWRHRIALGLLFALELFCNWAETYYTGYRVFLIGFLSWGLTAYILYILWSLYSEQRAASRITEQHTRIEPVLSRKEKRRLKNQGAQKNVQTR